jgi:hypothetical protein
VQDQPSAMALLTAIAILIRDELLPTLKGRPAFQARVAANGLEIVARELDHAPRANAEESARLEKLLGKPGDLAALNRQLCRCIAAGEMTLATPGLADHLWLTTLDKLLIDQPSYASYRRVLKKKRLPLQPESHK